jgi:hypothetical protein
MGAPGGGVAELDLRLAAHVAECGGVAAIAHALAKFGHVTEFDFLG